MIAVALALILSVPYEEGSLGVAIDGLTEAFTFAASKIGFDPRMRLTGCGRADCRWNLGDGVMLNAFFVEKTLYIYKLEAESAEKGDGSIRSSRFGMACRTIVDLFQPNLPTPEQASIAAAMTDAASAPTPRSGVQFYGLHDDTKAADNGARQARCGARAEEP